MKIRFYSSTLKIHLIEAIFIYFLTTQQSLHVEAREKPDLYTASDDVIRLTSKTFKPTVFEQNNNVIYVVQFYNTFCGHCQTFSPIYKELATRVKEWKSVIKIAAIDCSKYENVETCSENNIDGYPTILIFPPNPKFKDPKDAPTNLVSLGIEWTIDDIEEALINYVGGLSRSKRHYPKVVDAMQPILVDDVSEIQRLYPRVDEFDAFLNDQHSQQDLLFIVEADKSFLGRKLIIEYFRINAKLELRRILTSNTKLLRKILTDNDYSNLSQAQPLLLRLNSLDPGSLAQVLVRGEASKTLPTVGDPERQDFIMNRFKTFLDHYYFVELKELTGFDVDVDRRKENSHSTISNELDSNSQKQKSELEINYLINSESPESKKIFAQDILKGISYMLTHEIRMKGDIKPSEYNTIRNLLTILRKYLPLESWDPTLFNFVNNLRTKLDEDRYQYDKRGLTNQQMKDLLDFSGSDEARLKYSDEHWVTCHQSDLQHKGYTCSLWLLFHSLTVGEYSKAAPVRSKPTLVLTTMRDYIINFLGCTVCSTNFAKETQNLEASLSARNSSVLWLWNTHNHVNQRLNNERAESERRPLVDVIYPHHKRCRTCYVSNPKNIGSSGRNLDDIDWNLTAILEYMVNLYKPDNIVSPADLTLLLRRVRSKVNYDVVYPDMRGRSSKDLNSSAPEKWNIQSIFSTSDMGICMLLYLLCIVIVAAVCVSLNPRWKTINKTK